MCGVCYKEAVRRHNRDGTIFLVVLFLLLIGSLLATFGCLPESHDKDTVRDKESGCVVQFWSEVTGRVEKTQCKYGVASTKVPTPLYEGGPLVTWCVCKPWRMTTGSGT